MRRLEKEKLRPCYPKDANDFFVVRNAEFPAGFNPIGGFANEGNADLKKESEHSRKSRSLSRINLTSQRRTTAAQLVEMEMDRSRSASKGEPKSPSLER